MAAKSENIFVTDFWFVRLDKEIITIFTKLSKDLLITVKDVFVFKDCKSLKTSICSS